MRNSSSESSSYIRLLFIHHRHYRNPSVFDALFYDFIVGDYFNHFSLSNCDVGLEAQDFWLYSNDKRDYKKKLMEAEEKLMKVTGIGGLALSMGAAAASKKLWNYFLSPSLKKYMAVRALFGTIVFVKNSGMIATTQELPMMRLTIIAWQLSTLLSQGAI